MEVDERAFRMGGFELTEPLERGVRPRRDRSPHGGFERGWILTQDACELRARGGRVTSVVRPLGGAKSLGLRVVPEEEAELEHGRLAGRASVAPAVERHPHDDSGRDEGQGPHDQPDAGARRHLPSVARAPWAAGGKLLYLVKL